MKFIAEPQTIPNLIDASFDELNDIFLKQAESKPASKDSTQLNLRLNTFDDKNSQDSRHGQLIIDECLVCTNISDAISAAQCLFSSDTPLSVCSELSPQKFVSSSSETDQDSANNPISSVCQVPPDETRSSTSMVKSQTQFIAQHSALINASAKINASASLSCYTTIQDQRVPPQMNANSSTLPPFSTTASQSNYVSMRWWSGAMLYDRQLLPKPKDVRRALCQVRCPESDKENIDDLTFIVSPFIVSNISIDVCTLFGWNDKEIKEMQKSQFKIIGNAQSMVGMTKRLHDHMNMFNLHSKLSEWSRNLFVIQNDVFVIFF